jgi:hypothetical protein
MPARIEIGKRRELLDAGAQLGEVLPPGSWLLSCATPGLTMALL